MTQFDSSQSITDSDSQVLASSPEPTESVELSHWTQAHTPAQILDADLQILELHAESLVEELFSSEVDSAFINSPDSVAIQFSPQHINALTTTSNFPLLPAALQSSSLAVYIPHQPIEEPFDPLNYLTQLPLNPQDSAVSQLDNLQKQYWQDRILLGAGGLALLVILLGSLGNYLYGRSNAGLGLGSTASNATQLSRDPFLDYLQQSLQRLNTTPAKLAQPKSSPEASASGLSLPPLPQPTLGSAIATKSPIISAPSASVTVAASNPGRPLSSNPPAPSTVALPQIPIATLPPPPPMGDPAAPANLADNSAGSAPQALTFPTAIPTSGGNSANAGDPTLPSISNPPIPPVAINIPTKMAAPPAANRPARTLTGVMRMGDQSLALIEVNGVTRRIRLGETINADGAILMQVGDQEAIVQHGKDQYTIQVGQRF